MAGKTATQANAFVHSATIALKDITLQTALDRGTTRAVNNRIAFANEGKALLDRQAAGASTALREWRMP